MTGRAPTKMETLQAVVVVRMRGPAVHHNTVVPPLLSIFHRSSGGGGGAVSSAGPARPQRDGPGASGVGSAMNRGSGMDGLPRRRTFLTGEDDFNLSSNP
jgi:hypothetical protein